MSEDPLAMVADVPPDADDAKIEKATAKTETADSKDKDGASVDGR